MGFLMSILISKKFQINRNMLGVSKSKSRFEFNRCGVSIYVDSGYSILAQQIPGLVNRVKQAI